MQVAFNMQSHEDVYIRGYEEVQELKHGLNAYFPFYNEARRHMSLDYQTPGVVYRSGR